MPEMNKINMHTSYFARVLHHPRVRSGELEPVSIAHSQPPGFLFNTDHLLQPHRDMVANLKSGKLSEELYRYQYISLLNSRLSAKLYLIDASFKNSVLLCWEKPEAFCHRRIFAEWYYQKTGFIVPELVFEGEQQELTL